MDVDGVISLFGFPPVKRPDGAFHTVDGIPHLLSHTAGALLRELAPAFEVVWCTGWEDKADEYLPAALNLPDRWPFLRFGGSPGSPRHWKLHAIEAHAGDRRPLAWIDDDHGGCEDWARGRPGETLLLTTDPAVGITAAHVQRLLAWAASVSGD